MNPAPRSTTSTLGLALPLAILGIAACNALPSFTEACRHDLYAHGAAVAFAIWLAPSLWRILMQRASIRPCLLWLVLALVLGTAGSMSDLRILHHLALAAAVAGAFGWRTSGLLILAASATWLPATGWILSHWMSGGLTGWERPLGATLLSILLLALTRSPHTQPLQNHPEP